jgi:serine protease AprX
MGIHQIIFVPGAVPTPPIKTDAGVEINISPNPFSETTAIEISLSQSSEMKIELFDLQGRKIRTIADENFAEGKNEINLNKESLAAGIYFLQFKTQTETITKKLVVE